MSEMGRGPWDRGEVGEIWLGTRDEMRGMHDQCLSLPSWYRDVVGGIDTEGGRKRGRDELTGC